MKKEERTERAKQEKEEKERQQREAEQEVVLSEKEQLRIRLEQIEEGNLAHQEAKCENTEPCEPVAEEEGGEEA